MTKKKFFKTTKMKELKKDILDKYSLKRIEMLGSSGNFDTSKCVNKDGYFYIIKIRREKSKETMEKFSKEISVNKALSNNKDSKIEFPKFVDCQINKKPEWLIYKYINGRPAGQWNYFNPQELNKIFNNLNYVILFLLKTKVIEKEFKQIRHTEMFNDFKKCQKTLKQFFTKNEIKKGIEIIKQSKKLLNKTKLILTHGDLHPANIIITKNNKISIIDWFDSQLNNRVYDATCLWFKLWNYPEKQKLFLVNFLKNINNKKEFEKLFKINQIRLTPKMLEVANDVKKSLLENQIQEKNKLNKLIKYLIENYKNIIYDQSRKYN
ncbi:phosphotransferase [Patescibacteria group bacterium]|nr:phosphotransferase [Patescibacteria group bacterium]